ncbi:MAG: ethylbenzene dehydrogenase-related protein, partial [Planctomycetota bacterium]
MILKQKCAVLVLMAVAILAGCGGSDAPVVIVGFQAGDTLPGYIHIIPRGSRADVQAKGLYAGGQWTVETCRLLNTGNADDARFEVGVNTHFAIAVTDNSGGTHNGANVVDLLWSGTPGSATVVVGDLATLGEAAPAIDGDASDAAWTAAPVSSLGFGPQSGDNGVTGATVQAAYLDEFIYFRVTWTDPTATENIHRKRWTYDGAMWSRNSENEDRLYFMFDINGATGTATAGSMAGTTTPFQNNGCAMSCHGDGVMRTDFGRVDTWHWKATRTDPSGYLDDKHMVAASPSDDGRKPDQGAAAYFDNLNGVGTEPAYRSARGFQASPDFLFMLADESDFAEAKTNDAGFAAGDFLPGYVQRFPRNSRADVTTRGVFQSGQWTVEFCRALDSGNTWQWGSPVRFRDDALWQAGDTIPGYVTTPPIGSFGDVQAMGQWSNAVLGVNWTVEICRDLVTSSPDDTQFDPTDDTVIPVFSLGVTDNSGGTHDGEPVISLLWNGPAQNSPPWVKADHLTNVGNHPPPVIDGSGSDAVWADPLTGTTTVTLSAQSPVFGGPAQNIGFVSVQAVRSDTKIYFKFEWADPSRNEFREQWTFGGTSWSQNSENEDRLYVMWDIDGAEGTGTPGSPGTGVAFTAAGCTVLCHGDGLMHTSLNTVDTWHWKATRNNGSGWLDDKFADPVDRHADDGAGLASRNRNAAGDLPNYQAFGDPSADAVHLHFAGRTGPDDTAFVVGFRHPFALGLTDSSGGSHDGAPLLHLLWGGTSTPTELVALDLVGTAAGPPTVDGDGTDAAWSLASPSNVATSAQSGGGFGISSAELRAVHDRDNIYVRVRWTDPTATRDRLKNRRAFDGAAWSTTGARDEDRVYFLWGMDEALGTATAGQADGTTTPFRLVGCAMSCHGDGVMRTAMGMLDTWHWKAARTDGLYFTDDKYFTAAASGVSGRKG